MVDRATNVNVSPHHTMDSTTPTKSRCFLLLAESANSQEHLIQKIGESCEKYSPICAIKKKRKEKKRRVSGMKPSTVTTAGPGGRPKKACGIPPPPLAPRPSPLAQHRERDRRVEGESCLGSERVGSCQGSLSLLEKTNTKVLCFEANAFLH